MHDDEGTACQRDLDAVLRFLVFEVEPPGGADGEGGDERSLSEFLLIVRMVADPVLSVPVVIQEDTVEFESSGEQGIDLRFDSDEGGRSHLRDVLDSRVRVIGSGISVPGNEAGHGDALPVHPNMRLPPRNLLHEGIEE
jgi:hypothetical protein